MAVREIKKNRILNANCFNYRMDPCYIKRWDQSRRISMTDLLYIVLTLVFLAVSWGFIVACEQLMQEKKK